ncbi:MULTISPECIES: DUF1517 domain-containing protein [Cyanophyceae]|uniref:DUF1517 domain-containing protein n=1 Tax=Cyanophyceae TaxID=3028117 RepID=UPI000C074B78|nr:MULTISPECIES: DUF1517 domain-containing protein [Cyanophyceae]QCS49897.1 DUF1517 domain-containing protein [Picosynechococcus sp. PCC 11901]
MIKRFFYGAIAIVLAFTLIFTPADNAWAARSGGRIGGGSFRSAPSRSFSPGPARRAPVGGGYGYGFGGGFGFPFLLPFFGFGGFSGIFGLFIMLAIAGFLVRTFQNVMGGGMNEGDSLGYSAPSSKISVAKVQVGLLAQARDLQQDLNRLASTADTGTPAGRAKVLQESTLALLRHPEYWVYGASESLEAGVDAAEAKFNQLALNERSKFTAETLSNVDNERDVAGKSASADLVKSDGTPNEYIMVTIIAGAMGKVDLPKVTDSQSLEQAIRQIGALGGDRLLALEVLWTPQAIGDTLSTDDILTYYPDINLV